MNAARPADLARRLFNSVRRERPSAELRARILLAGRQELERARVSAIDTRRGPEQSPEHASAKGSPRRAGAARRWMAVGAFAAAAAGLLAYVAAPRAPESAVMISAEHAGAPEPRLSSSAGATGNGARGDAPRTPSEVEPPASEVEARPGAHDATARPPRPSPRTRAGAVGSPDSKAPARAEVHPSSAPTEPEEVKAPAPEAPPRASLGEQLDQIKRVRTALRAGDPRRALELIDAYRARGDGDELAAEASLLRIEALAMSGQNAAAAAAARQFASDYPNSPLIDRALSYAGAAQR